MSQAAPLNTRAVDLNPANLRQQIEANHAAAQLRAEALDQLRRLDQRIHWLERKHKRLPIGNGKRKTAKELAETRQRQQQLRDVLNA